MICDYPVEITEVGPRDGLQNLKEYVETAKKIKLICGLVTSGLKKIELGSFVHPKAIPQFKDINQIVAGVIGLAGVKFSALVPNLKGAENAFINGVRNLVFVFSVSESHNLNNVRRTRNESVKELGRIKEMTASWPNVHLSVNMATAFGCPFELKVSKDSVLSYVRKVDELGIRKVTLCDTVGYANPKQVQDLASSCMETFPELKFGVHFHNTRGLGLANALAAYQVGIRSFESSVAGLGGCPFAPGASGNVATEDLAFMFNEMGVDTGINISKLLEVSSFINVEIPSAAVTSAVYQAGLPSQKQILERVE